MSVCTVCVYVEHVRYVCTVCVYGMRIPYTHTVHTQPPAREMRHACTASIMQGLSVFHTSSTERVPDDRERCLHSVHYTSTCTCACTGNEEGMYGIPTRSCKIRRTVTVYDLSHREGLALSLTSS